jgi:hypothetical protein
VSEPAVSSAPDGEGWTVQAAKKERMRQLERIFVSRWIGTNIANPGPAAP